VFTDELTERIAREPIGFKVLVQVADDDDIVDDSTVMNWRIPRGISYRENLESNHSRAQGCI
jgi:hypothetical protein